MNNILINISELKNILSKLSLAVENARINPKSSWIELETISDKNMSIKISNYDYYLESDIAISVDNYSEQNKIHATVDANTFISLVSKLEEDFVNISERMNALILTSSNNEYTFPIIKENGIVRTVDRISFDEENSNKVTMSGNDLASVANANAKGLVNSQFSNEIQQFIYVDNEGALTFTENIYVNTFNNKANEEFRFLLNASQAKLLKVFENVEDVDVYVQNSKNYESSFNVQFKDTSNNRIKMIFITQSQRVTDKFPSIKLRELANAVSETHAVISKKEFEKALSRLMVFDKKFDITVLNYSKLVFGKDSVKLVSVKNKNYEIVKYQSYTNTVEHEAIIRFADIVNQLKAINSEFIDVSYGDSPALVINGNIKQLIPEIVEG